MVYCYVYMSKMVFLIYSFDSNHKKPGHDRDHALTTSYVESLGVHRQILH